MSNHFLDNSYIYIKMTVLITLSLLLWQVGYYGCYGSWFDFWKGEQCAITPNFKAELEFGLLEKLHGQHIARSHAMWAMASHLSEEQPRQPLSMVFCGTTGTGKNLVSSILAEAALGKFPTHIHTYTGRLDFPNERNLEVYQNQLSYDIRRYVKECPHSIFIFDEIDKMPANLLDVVKPFLDFHTHVNHVDYRKAVFIFLTNIGGLEINTAYNQLRQKGLKREDITYSHLEAILRRTLFEEDGLLKNSIVISDHLLRYYIPFLPLERHHVMQCITYEMNIRGIFRDTNFVDTVIQNIDFNENGISKSGCKRVANFVSLEYHRRKDEM